MAIDAENCDIANRQLVGVGMSDQISVMMPKVSMTPEEALAHAAWIVALADPMGEAFPVILQRVCNT